MTSIPVADPVALTQALIRCPSVTPADAGALDVLIQALEPLGFVCHRLRFEAEGTPPIDNLYARLGTAGPNLCFAGHTDVVPPGDLAAWTANPFAGTIADGKLYGRGASDMKAAIAAFVAAIGKRLAAKGAPAGSISLLITGDEEGPSINGTRKVLDWLVKQGEVMDACIVGEPTNPHYLGEMIKVGRRGSITGHLTVHGTQGHVAYPHLADNPLPRLIRMLAALTAEPLDQGNAHFQPSTLAITTIDVGNPASNVIPAKGSASFNIRFNDEHTSEALKEWIRRTCDSVGGPYDVTFHVAGESFLTPPGHLSGLVADAIQRVTGHRPELSTTGGTSDARFIKNHCPVVEFGIVGQTMHKVDEHVSVRDVERLTDIYVAIIDGFFAADNVTHESVSGKA
jgi:succinyl-diaminopimelate desuccinylase